MTPPNAARRRAPRAGTVALIAAALLGPLVALGKGIMQPQGDDYAKVRARTAASLCIVTMDGIAPKDLSLYNPALPADASLDEIARLGVTVHYAYGATNTSPAAVASIMTGQLPSTHGVLAFGDRVNDELSTLGKLFEQRGLRTALVTNVPLSSACGLGAGNAIERVGLGVQGIADQAYQWLAGTGEEYVFLWVHYHPRPDDVDRGQTFSRLLTRVVEGLKQSRRYEGTFMLACGTYGRERGDLAVPMLWKIPKRTAVGASRNGPCSTLDVTATLFEAFGLRGNASLPGRSLVGSPHKPLYSGHYFGDNALFELFAPRSRERALGIRNHKYGVTTGPGRTDLGVYVMAEDPIRSLLGSDEGTRVKDYLLDQLTRRRDKIPTQKFPPRRGALDPAVRGILDAMGIETTDG